MGESSLDVVGIGNAIVDVIAHAEEKDLVALELTKGAMTLIDAARAEFLYENMGSAVEISGGSAANTMVGLSRLGGAAGYIGKVRNDQLGGIFHHDISTARVEFPTRPAIAGPPTARCLIFVTPDAQRTMETYLGASVGLGPDDLDHGLIRRAKVTYLEGYLWDETPAQEAFVLASKIAHEAGNKVALTLSDPFCVERHRRSFQDLVEAHVDILFANEIEILSLYQSKTFDQALQRIRGRCEVAALTRSEKGSVIVAGEEVHVIDAEPVDAVVDTTGAGDLFAAGFLFGLARNHDLAACGRIGSICAAEIISHFGARPETPLDELIHARMGSGVRD
ncbi:MAG: adenosine kinase [Alphaproteobacteria bacterium]|nr:adenosine kinase [Alphaproteobacteria bacterium]